MKNLKASETRVTKNKKGFTLIEIIVVLIILAILAAFALPSMLGFVREARGKAYITEARVGIVAAQTVVTQAVASGNPTNVNSSTKITTDPTFINMTSDVKGAFSDIKIDSGYPSAVTSSGALYRVTGLTYKPQDTNYTITISDGNTTVTYPK